MKKSISLLLAALLVMLSVFVTPTAVYASKKAESTRAIAIVFDNSGSMYMDGEQAWCRATYAMEVFASMLNKGDTLQIYPMHPITVEGKEYTMNKPFTVTDASQASAIRNIHTPKALGTPIESVDAAINGVNKLKADKKYIIVLTDGDSFYKNGNAMSATETKKQLDRRFEKYSGKKMTMMYLGIGKKVVMPGTAESKYFTKKQAKNSEDTLSALTEMCNQIFGRDTLPKSHLSGKKIKLDISISKLIVFVQGENVSDLKVTGDDGNAGKLESTASTKYGTAGCKNYKSVPDKSLQGMMVTYTDCAAGNYTIDYKGTASNLEVYYEPDADLDFVFTDAEGNLVEPDSLYEGDYKVSFGMKDGKTGQLISSELLGKPHYEGSYFINEQKKDFSHDGNSGEVPVALSMNDTFDANLTVTYLSGYTITKDASDFGWTEGGIKVAAHPAGDLKLEISGGDDKYSLQDLEQGQPYIAKVYYQGEQLTGKELEKVQLKWDPDTSYVEIKKEFADDHYNLTLHYKDPAHPANTTCGECKVTIYAIYAAKGSDESNAQTTMTYDIYDDFSEAKVELILEQDYIVLSKLAESKEIVAKLSMNGKPLAAEEFDAVAFQVDCGKLNYELTPKKEDSSYLIKLLPTDGITEGDYPIKVTTEYTDHIDRVTQSEDSATITLSKIPLWAKWLLWLILLILLILIIWKILHIRVLPKTVRHKKDECYMSVTGKNVTEGTDFNAKLSGKQLSVRTQYNGNTAGINITNMKPGKESYLCKPQHKRSMIVRPENVKMIGEVTYADINGVGFVYDKKEGKLVPEDPDLTQFTIANNANISFDGRVEENGRTKKNHADIPLTFKKR